MKHIKVLTIILIVLGINGRIFCAFSKTNQNDRANGNSEVQPEKKLVRSYSIDIPTFTRNLKRETGGKNDESFQQLFYRFLKEKKIDIGDPSAVFLKKDDSHLLVRATEQKLNQIDLLVNKLNENP